MNVSRVWLPPEGKATRLLILRHGEVNAESRKALYGQLDVELSERGHAQSARTGAALSTQPIEAVYTSDLSRASILGREIARHHELEPHPDPRLRERHFGHWQGLLWEHIETTYPEELKQYSEKRHHMRVPGPSENFPDVRARLVPFLAEVLEKHRGQTVAIACHSGPARILLAEALGLPIDGIFTFEQNYCCLNAIDYFDTGRVRVQLLNDTHHLGDLFSV